MIWASVAGLQPDNGQKPGTLSSLTSAPRPTPPLSLGETAEPVAHNPKGKTIEQKDPLSSAHSDNKTFGAMGMSQTCVPMSRK